MFQIWDEYSAAFDRISSLSVPHEEKYKKVSQRVLERGHESVLDLGCGSGLLEKRLLTAGYKGKLVAIDFSTRMLEIARKETGYYSGIKFIVGNIENMVWPGEHFECVVTINLLHLIKNVSSVLENISNTLERNGELIIITPIPVGSTMKIIIENFAKKNMFEKMIVLGKIVINIIPLIKMIRLQGKVDRLEKRGSIHYLTLEELMPELIRFGLKPIEVRSIQAEQNWIIFAVKN